MAAGDVITIIEDNVARKGVVFDGTDDYILVDAHAVERVAANDTTGTYTAWIYVDDIVNAGARQTILSAGDNDSANEYLRFSVETLGRLQITLKQGGANQFNIYTDTGIITARTWKHVAIVQNGTQPVLYVNGLAVSGTNQTATDLTMWYDELANVDKFAVGVNESNGTHTDDFKGAIGQVKYWSRALSAAEVLKDANGESVSTLEYPDSTYLRLNITMADNGTTDSGAGEDNGTLTGHAHYGGYISAHSMALERNCTGHAAERSETIQLSPSKLMTVIVRGD
jgi:hypothetical protein